MRKSPKLRLVGFSVAPTNGLETWQGVQWKGNQLDTRVPAKADLIGYRHKGNQSKTSAMSRQIATRPTLPCVTRHLRTCRAVENQQSKAGAHTPLRRELRERCISAFSVVRVVVRILLLKEYGIPHSPPGPLFRPHDSAVGLSVCPLDPRHHLFKCAGRKVE